MFYLMQLKTSINRPLGLEIEGGSDRAECSYIRVKSIRPGSVADRSGLIRIGDEIVQFDGQLMVGETHSEALQSNADVDSRCS